MDAQNRRRPRGLVSGRNVSPCDYLDYFVLLRGLIMKLISMKAPGHDLTNHSESSVLSNESMHFQTDNVGDVQQILYKGALPLSQSAS